MNASQPLRTRKQACEIINAWGYPIKPRYLEKLCMQGEGPGSYRIFGRRKLYRDQDLLAWLESRCKPGDVAV